MQDNKPNNRNLIWSRNITEHFLQLYKQNECLYDKNHEDYNNPSVKTYALHKIVHKMQVFLPNIEVKDIQSKIRVIRSKFSEDISNIIAAKTSGDKYVPKLYCFDQLEFLRKHMILNEGSLHENSFSKYNPNDSADGQTEDSDASQYDELLQVKSKRKFMWKRENIKAFIKILKAYDILHDVNHKDFLKHELRQIAFTKLLKDTRKVEPQITLENIREKMRCLRTQYKKEIRGIKQAQKNNDPYTPKLWCFKLLSNLYTDDIEVKSYPKLNVEDMSEDSNLSKTDLTHVNPNNSNHTNSNELLEIEQVFDKNEIEHDQESINLSTTEKNEMEHDQESINLSTIEDTTEDDDDDKHTMKNNEEVKYDWLGELVVSQLGIISPRYRSEFSWAVQSLIHKYIMQSKANENEISSSNSSTTGTGKKRKASSRKDIVLPKSSNVSFNIRFV